MPWRLGQSGNPGGRPRAVGEVRDLAREQTGTAIETLASICQNGRSESARVAAAVALLDRGWGRAVASTDLTLNTVIKPVELMSDEEIMARLAELQAEAAMAPDDDRLIAQQ